ncbi:alpha/beta-hydrolase family protein [Streptomyces sp. NPDC055189]
MAVSDGVEAPHGHRYGTATVDGWAAIVPREGWPPQDTEKLPPRSRVSRAWASGRAGRRERGRPTRAAW